MMMMMTITDQECKF